MKRRIREAEKDLAVIIANTPPANSAASKMKLQRVNFAWGNTTEEIESSIDEVEKAADFLSA